MNHTIRSLSEVAASLVPPIQDFDRDEFVRLQFRCATLERCLTGEDALKATVAALEAQTVHLAGELRQARTERDRLLETLKAAVDLTQGSLAQIADRDRDGPRTASTGGAS